MTIETFFEKFDQFADAPDAVAKMRELVLQLAVQGKLVRQDPGDESAAEMVRLLRPLPRPARFDKRSSASIQGISALSVGPTDRAIPPGWICVPLVQIARLESGHTPSRSRPDWWGGDVPWVGVVDARLHNGKTIFRTLQHTNEAGLANSAARLLPEGTVCVSRTASVGYVTILGRPMATSQDFVNWVPSTAVTSAWLRLVFTAEKSAFSRFSKGAVHQTIYFPEWLSMHISLPPLAEQKRIVAKVDELMALCDRLEAQQREREERHAALSRAALTRSTEAPTPENLQLLFHSSFSIAPADLRRTIVTLAVRGALVSQSPTDEPAKDLLKRISQSVESGKRRRPAESLPQLDEDCIPFQIPSNWKWARFGDVAKIASDLVDPAAFQEAIHLAPDNVEKGTGVLLPCNTVGGDKVTSAKHRFHPGQIVYSKIRPNLSKVALVDFEGLCSADMYPIDALIEPAFLHRYMLSEPFLRQAVKSDTRVAMPKLNQMELNAIPVPVPPLDEQRRIVAKVNALLTLADRLELQLAMARDASSSLLDAAIAELTNSQRPT